MIIDKPDKKFDGINPYLVRAYHKYHISKTVSISVVGMNFEDSLDIGGIAIKLVFQSA